MIEQTSSQEIGQYGYSHWSGKPITTDTHVAYFVPQSVFDGWEAYCSCGEWRAFENFYEMDPDTRNQRDEIIKRLKAQFSIHCDEASA